MNFDNFWYWLPLDGKVQFIAMCATVAVAVLFILWSAICHIDDIIAVFFYLLYRCGVHIGLTAARTTNYMINFYSDLDPAKPKRADTEYWERRVRKHV